MRPKAALWRLREQSSADGSFYRIKQINAQRNFDTIRVYAVTEYDSVDLDRTQVQLKSYQFLCVCLITTATRRSSKLGLCASYVFIRNVHHNTAAASIISRSSYLQTVFMASIICTVP